MERESSIKIDEEALDTGPDYQKAKRSAFFISFLTLAFSLTDATKQAVTEATILDVDFQFPSVAVLVTLFGAVLYCAANYHIQHGREVRAHCQLIEKYKPSDTSAALEGITKDLEDIRKNSNSAAGWTDEIIKNLQAVAIREGKFDDRLANWSSGVNQIAMDIFDDLTPGRVRTDDGREIRDLRKKYSERIIPHTEEKIINEMRRLISEQTRHNVKISLGELSSNIKNSNATIRDNLPTALYKISSLQRELFKLSGKISNHEKIFFRAEAALVCALLAGSGLTAAFSIARHVGWPCG